MVSNSSRSSLKGSTGYGRQLDVGTFKDLLDAVDFPGAFFNKAPAVADKFPQFSLTAGRNIAAL